MMLSARIRTIYALKFLFYAHSFKISGVSELLDFIDLPQATFEMDCLSDALNRVKFKSYIHCNSEFTAPWGLRMPGFAGHAAFLVMLRGGCLVSFEDSQVSYSMAAGEVMLLPRGSGCVIQDHVTSEIVDFLKVNTGSPPRGEIWNYGGGGALTSILMGCFEFDLHLRNPLIESLPGVIYLKAAQLQSEPWLDTTLRFLASETANSRPGSDILVSRLTDMFFIQVVRAFMMLHKDCMKTTGWLKGLADPEIGQALRLIHERPAAPWTVANLAKEVGMSRTTFAVKFASILNQTPIDYLTSWRMQEAVSLMEKGEGSMPVIASAVGYTSEAAFAKAFKRELGESPGAFRRKVLALGSTASAVHV
jgi:AraC-type DNA-binding domain-containing proteins